MIGIIFLVVFLALMTGIGIWGMKKTKTLGDFFLGGRSLGPWVSAVAYGTSYFSAVIFIGFAGTQGWQFGLNALWIALGNAVIGAGAAWLVLARRTRRITQNLDAMTMPEYLQERYGAKHLKPVAASIIFFFLLPYSASVFKGLGHLFEKVFGIPYDLALLIMIAFTGIYLILGGYFAIAITDFIQGIIMFAGAAIMILVLSGQGGGYFEMIRKVAENYAIHVPPANQPSTLTVISLVFMTSFGTWGLPQMTQKFYAIKNEAVIPKAAIVTTVFALMIGFAAYSTGVFAHVFFDLTTVPRTAAGGINYDLIVPTLLTAHLPELLLALIMLLVLSASMSTLSSLVLVSSSSVAIDMNPNRVNVKTGKDNSVAMMRLLSGVFIIISYFISRFQISIIVYLMSLSWGAVSGSFAAPYILSLYSKKVTKAGAYAGLLTGLGVEIALFFILGASRSPLTASIAIVVPFIVVPVVSLFTAPPDKALLDKAFQGV
ncbi:SSS sodium solute transporter superfamily [Treponema primitia ZAS-2]|uniref:SSS sodium solute transporter superfamily n=1 Tax=Treponema primitia (strain ATCC BAA-887 / DSM 12427 / ZAS-2) TaxID=545694 RepID=F5YJ47_TREPZ|nr:sodium transporter [Treponema primitia]AEF86826.1 SSS sodium solute transporter superfamily [Treponema primitia ZAS-2]